MKKKDTNTAIIFVSQPGQRFRENISTTKITKIQHNLRVGKEALLLLITKTIEFTEPSSVRLKCLREICEMFLLKAVFDKKDFIGKCFPADLGKRHDQEE